MRRTVASRSAVAAAATTVAMRRIAPGAESGSLTSAPRNDSPGVTVSRSVPSASSAASSSRPPDADTPTTATMAATPIATPPAVSALRNRRLRTLPTATATASHARSRLRGGEAASRRHEPWTTGRGVVGDAAVAERDGAGQGAGELRVVGDDGDRRAVAVQVTQQVDDRGSRGGVEVAGGLVGQQEGRGTDDRAGDGDALLLAAGELARPVVGAVCQPDALQRARRARPPLACRDPAVQQARRDVVERAEPLQQEELLEHEADGTAAQRGQAPVTERRQVVPGHPHGARRRPVQRTREVEQRRLAGARRADQRDELAGLHPQ